MRKTAILFALVLFIVLTLTESNSLADASSNAISAPVLKWQNGGCKTTWCRTGWYASPAVADVDNDGKPEVIWTDYRIVVVNGEDGTGQWMLNNPGNGRGWPSVIVADVNNDGKLEIVTAHSGGWVTVTKFDGTTLTGWPQQPTPGNELRSLAVADVDANGDLEILVCSTRSDNQWFMFEPTGALRAGWPVHYPDSDSNGYAAGCFNENVGLADLDGNGRAEMIGPNDTHYVVGYNADATPLRADAMYGQVSGLNKVWARVGFHYDQAVDLRGYANCTAEQPLEPRPNFADSAPTLADINNDGVPEIIIIGNQYDCRTNPYTDLFHAPYILRADRTRWSGNGFDWTSLPVPDSNAAPLSEDYDVIETVMPNPVVADIDGDGYKEILFPSYDGRLHAYWLDRTEHDNWPFHVKQPDESFIRFGSEPAIVDLDNDGKAEVILTTWTQKGSNAAGQLIILNSDGSLLFAIDLPRDVAQSWDGALAAPTVANIDADSDLEVVVGTAHTGLVAYDFPNTSHARILWGTGRGSYLRTGTPPISLSRIYMPLIKK